MSSENDTASKRRAARRAKILKSSEERLKYLEGSRTLLDNNLVDNSVDTKRSSDEEKINQKNDIIESTPFSEKDFMIDTNSVMRRRQAALNRKNKETSEIDNENESIHDTEEKENIKKPITSISFSISLQEKNKKMHIIQESIILLFIIIYAIFLVMIQPFKTNQTYTKNIINQSSSWNPFIFRNSLIAYPPILVWVVFIRVTIGAIFTVYRSYIGISNNSSLIHFQGTTFGFVLSCLGPMGERISDLLMKGNYILTDVIIFFFSYYFLAATSVLTGLKVINQ